MSKEAERHVESLASALSILEAFRGDERLRLKDLFERTGLNRSRILRFAGTLASRGFLDAEEATGTYGLGPKLYSIGWALHESRRRFSDAVRPVLKALAQESGDTAFFSSIRNDVRLVVAREESSEGLRFVVEEGQTRPLHNGASSKVLLAFASTDLRERCLSHYASSADADVASLREELAEIRATGVCISRGEVTKHGFAVAVPVLNCFGAPHVLTLAGPLTKLNDSVAEAHRKRLTEAGRSLSSIIGDATRAAAVEPSR